MINNNRYFRKQVMKGEDMERQFKAYLIESDFLVEMTQGNNPDYDLRAIKGNIDVTFEVKYNSAVGKFKTVFVEYFQSGKPSGMQKTKADWQIHFTETGAIAGIRTSELDKYIKDNNLRLVSTTMKTKNGKVSGQGYRVPFDVMKLIRSNQNG